MNALARRTLILAVTVSGAVLGSGAALASSRLAGSSDGGRSAHSRYVVEELLPTGRAAAWALTVGNEVRNPPEAIVRTTDGGRRWTNVTPAGLGRETASKSINGLDVLGSRMWVTYGGLRPRHPTILVTSDGGRRWTRVGRAPSFCELNFVTASDGWCVDTGGAAGSMTVLLYRTTDGGRAWKKVSETPVPGEKGGTPGAIPFGCDKTIAITSPSTGFASAFCAGGHAFVDMTRDGGARWSRVLSGPVDDSGSGFGVAVMHGNDVALGFLPDGRRGLGRTGVEHSSNGGATWALSRPPGQPQGYAVDAVTPDVWRLTREHTILATNDAGRTWTKIRSNADLGSNEATDFVSPSVAWEIDGANDSRIIRTADGGRKWATVDLPAP